MDIAPIESRVERAIANVKSRQPRFSKPDPNRFFNSILELTQVDEFKDEPAYKADSRERDAWLDKIWRKEPHFAGVLASVNQINANRGWVYVGGRNQVNKYTQITHSFWATPDLQGYRPHIRMASNAFYTSNLGYVGEIGREIRASRADRAMLQNDNVQPDQKKRVLDRIIKNGAVRTLFFVDPVCCRLTGSPDYPLEYTPAIDITNAQKWSTDDFFRICSMPNTNEGFYGLGFCAVSRILESMKIFIGLVIHDQEMVRARLPETLLLLRGISQDQWDMAMEDREHALNAKGYQYFGNTYVFASNFELSAQLLKFSEVPEGLDRQVFTDVMMYLYALNIGFSPEEFWPVSRGSLSRGTEAKVQHRNAVSKGGMDFPLSFQENWQKLIPDTLHYEMQERDVEGDMLEGELQKLQISNILNMMTLGSPTLEPAITREEARQILVAKQVIPDNWTEETEPVSATDDDIKARLFENDRILRCAYKWPGEPIIMYKWPQNITRVLVNRGSELITNRYISIPKSRQVDSTAVLYEGEDFEITAGDVIAAIDEGKKRLGDEYANLLAAPVFKEKENE